MAPPTPLDPELLVTAVAVTIADDLLRVTLSSGELIGIPLNRFPVLATASPEALGEWQLVAGGTMVHWPQLDEDLSVFGLLPRTLREAISASRSARTTEVDVTGLWLAAEWVRNIDIRRDPPARTRAQRRRPRVLSRGHAA